MTAHTLGKYSILRMLGAGGMGSVCLARDPMLDREVAIKVILPHLTHQPGFYERFHREARLVASLRHPRIVQVYDFSIERGDPDTESDDQPYMVMEYLNGGSLKDRLAALRSAGQAMPMDEVARIIVAVAEALDHAHARGLVHRDVKPANILFRSQGAAQDEPVLSDFGVARIVGESSPAAPGSPGGGGGIVGTPAYMSPEQASNAEVDARSDIYSLGVVLYEMVCGRTPFRDDSPAVILKMHIEQAPPPPAQFNPRVPASVQEVILRALAKQPAARFSRAGELAAALAAATAAPAGEAALESPTLLDSNLPPPVASPAQQAASTKDAARKQGLFSSAAMLAEVVSPLVGQGMPATERLPQGRLRRLIAIISLISVTLAAIDFVFRTVDRASQQFTRLNGVLPYLVLPALVCAFGLAVYGAIRARERTNRRLAVVTAAVLGAASLMWGGWRVHQASLPLKGPLVLVAEFKGCAGCPDRIFDDDIYNELLKQSAAFNFPIEVRRVRESDHPIVGDTLAARQLGADNKATLVIWGAYDAENVSPQFELLGAPQGAAPLLGTDDLRSFGYNLAASTSKLEHVAFLALGLMRCLAGDYENALSLLERAINSLPADQTEVSAEAAYFYRANARLRTGKHISDVISDLEKARDYDPKSAAIRHNLSIAYINACKPDGTPALDWALRENTYVVDSGRSDAIPFEVRGWIHELMGNWDEASDAYEEALRRNSDDASVGASLAHALAMLGRTDDAMQAAQPQASSSLITATTPFSSAVTAAEANWQAGRFDEAALDYQRAVSEARAMNRPADEVAHLQVYTGMSQMKAQRWHDAAATLEAAVKSMPRYFGLRSKRLNSPHVLLGMSYHHLQDYDKAAGNFRRALEIYPCDANTLVQLGSTLLDARQYDDALSALRQAETADPANAAVDFYRSLVLTAQNRPAAEVDAALQSAAKKYAAQVEREPGNAEARESLERVRALLASEPQGVREAIEQALEALARADYTAALAPARQAVALAPESGLAQRLLGRALRGAGQLKEALSALLIAQQLEPEEPLVHYELGMVYSLLNQAKDAVMAFRKAVDLKPEDGVSWIQLANALWRAGQLEEAQAAGQRAVQLLPGDSLAQGTLGMVLFASQQFTSAVSPLQQAVSLSPNYALALQFLGSAHYRLGQLDAAVDAIRRARDLEPQNAETQAQYAFLLAEQGKAEAAFEEAQRALALNAGPPNALVQYALGMGFRAQGKVPQANAAFEAVARDATAEPALREKARAMIE